LKVLKKDNYLSLIKIHLIYIIESGGRKEVSDVFFFFYALATGMLTIAVGFTNNNITIVCIIDDLLDKHYSCLYHN